MTVFLLLIVSLHLLCTFDLLVVWQGRKGDVQETFKNHAQIFFKMKDATNLAWLAFVLAVAVGFGTVFDAPSPFTRKDMARGLVKLRSQTQQLTVQPKKARVLLGLNANLDAVVTDGAYLLRRLEGISETEPVRDAVNVVSPADLSALFAHHVA